MILIRNSAGIATAAFLALVFLPSIGVTACLIDSSRPIAALSPDEMRARNLFVTDVCSRRRENLYDVTDTGLKDHLEKPSLPPINYDEIYPGSSKQAHHEGRALMAFIVDADGNVSHVSVISSSGHQDLDDAAAIFLAGTHIDNPARLNGINVPVIMYQRFEFKLRVRHER
jgi:TonB family protein